MHASRLTFCTNMIPRLTHRNSIARVAIYLAGLAAPLRARGANNAETKLCDQL